MSERKDGGPAFPVHLPGRDDPLGYWGMSLRDYFAAQALIGLASKWGCSEDDDDAQIAATAAYAIADAMLKERAR